MRCYKIHSMMYASANHHGLRWGNPAKELEVVLGQGVRDDNHKYCFSRFFMNTKYPWIELKLGFWVCSSSFHRTVILACSSVTIYLR